MSNNSRAETPYVYYDQIGHLLRRAYQRHVSLFQRLIPDEQLTLAQFAVLCSIGDQGMCSLTEIVSLTAVDQTTARGVLDRLKVRGLVKISQDKEDRRKTVVQLTRSGETLLAQSISHARIVTEETYGTLNPGERIALAFLLRKMLGLRLTDQDETEG